ncbi:MAG: 16S rRNA (cytosine(1402)-N(4))-methyltransferase RsmH [Candidatus Marinamargulisbacteria bacterium]
MMHFNVSNSSVIVDGTMGFGGHAEAILTQYPDAIYYGFDKDPFAIKMASERCQSLGDVTLIRAPFSHIFQEITERGVIPTHILLDLGVSSYQIDLSKRGFSFQMDEPLDMRMDVDQSLTAATVLNTYSKEALITILRDEGDIRRPERLVDVIINTRQLAPYQTTGQLKEAVKKGLFSRSRGQWIADVTRVFQAIRIAVNNEMSEIDTFLNELLSHTNITVGVMTFQPNEDRRIKRFVKQHQLEVVTKKPLQSTYHECKKNPREKSAKLRIFKV